MNSLVLCLAVCVVAAPDVPEPETPAVETYYPDGLRLPGTYTPEQCRGLFDIFTVFVDLIQWIVLGIKVVVVSVILNIILSVLTYARMRRIEHRLDGLIIAPENKP